MDVYFVEQLNLGQKIWNIIPIGVQMYSDDTKLTIDREHIGESASIIDRFGILTLEAIS
jgi:hypothetical protein